MREIKTNQSFFLACCLLAVIVGFYHANKFFFPNGSNATRHLIFVGICAISAFGFIKRPKWFTYFFGLLLLQQLYSHGIYFYNQWKNANLFDGKSFAIIILMPIIFMALLKDKKHASKAS